MDAGNALTFNDNDYNQAYTLYYIPQKHEGYIHNNNVLTVSSTDNREMGILLDFNRAPNIATNDTARLSMYRDIVSDTQLTVYNDRTTFELAVADNLNKTASNHYSGDRIIARKYEHNDTYYIQNEHEENGTKEHWDQYNRIVEEIALIDYDGKTKIGANKLVVGDIDVYRLLTDLASATKLNIDNYKTTGFIPDYRNKDNYREIEKTIDGTA